MILAVSILLMLKVIATVGQHQHGSHGNSLGLDTLDDKTQGFIVSEDDILWEEIIASAKNMAETLFDADVPGKLGITRARTRRRRRQVSQDDIKDALCRDKNPGEFFRLVAGESHCRDVVACADHGLQAIRCPPGLAFSLRQQTCDWRAAVKDCNQVTCYFERSDPQSVISNTSEVAAPAGAAPLPHHGARVLALGRDRVR